MFLDLNQFFKTLDREVQDQCERLWFVSGVGEYLKAGEGQMSLLPLAYDHPFTGEKTMCFHLGQSYSLGFIEEDDLNPLAEMMANVMTRGEVKFNDAKRVLKNLVDGPGNNSPAYFKFCAPKMILEFLRNAIDDLAEDVKERIMLQQEWKAGDLALIDNMAVAHLPVPKTQSLPLLSGLRVFHRTTMVDTEKVPRNFRGAPAVLLVGDGYGLKRSKGDGGQVNPVAMREILAQLVSAAREAGDLADQAGGEARAMQDKPAKEEALRALDAGGFSVDLFRDVDEQVENAKAAGKEAYTKTLKKLMIKLHPDRNQDREDMVPVFKYLRRLRKEQGRSGESALGKNKDKIISRLRKKSEIVGAGTFVSAAEQAAMA